jgi:Family of unknown function (DUF6452)
VRIYEKYLPVNSAPHGLGLYLQINCKPLKFVRFVSLFFITVGCLNEPDCLITSTNLAKIAFVNGKNIREITFDEIRVSGLDKIYYENAKVSSVQLPVNPETTEITFTFAFENRVETLHLKYKTSVQIISDKCGAFTNYGDLEIIESSFTDTQVVDNQLSTNATVNIQISGD